jgi:hypothetical protein
MVARQPTGRWDRETSGLARFGIATVLVLADSATSASVAKKAPLEQKRRHTGRKCVGGVAYFSEVKLVSLSERYREECALLDRGAIRWKRIHQWIWTTVALLTLSSLLLAVGGLKLGDQAPGYNAVLDWLLPLFNGTVMLLTAVQLLCGAKGKWLGHRAAVQTLWKHCMYYRARVAPFSGPDADAVFERQMTETVREAAARKTSPAAGWLTRVWNAAVEQLTLPRPLPEDSSHAPIEGLKPSFVGPEGDQRMYVRGRLRSQLQWYLVKARLNRNRYVLLQFAIMGLTTANLIGLLIVGRQFWMIGSTVTVLVFVAWRGFLDCYSLWFQYRFAAERLEQIEAAFHNRRPPFDADGEDERTRRLVVQVEDELFREFEAWQHVRLGGRVR